MYGIVYVLLFGQVGVWFNKGELCQKRRTWASVIILVIEKCEKQVSSLCVTSCVDMRKCFTIKNKSNTHETQAPYNCQILN